MDLELYPLCHKEVNMKKYFNILAIAGILTTGAVFADDVESADDAVVSAETLQISEPTQDSNPKTKFPRGMQFGLGISATSGFEGFIGYANKNFDDFWWKRLGVRVSYGTTAPVQGFINSSLSNLADDVKMGDIKITNPSFSMYHAGAVVDFYPFGNTWFLGGWRLSGGYMFGRTRMAANLYGNVVMDGVDEVFEFKLDGTNYRYTGGEMNAGADVTWKFSGPYLGTGFDLGILWGVKFYTDFGLVFSKAPTAKLDVEVTGLEVEQGGIWTSVQGDNILMNDLNVVKDNALREANDALGKATVYPMVKLGFMYRF